MSDNRGSITSSTYSGHSQSTNTATTSSAPTESIKTVEIQSGGTSDVLQVAPSMSHRNGPIKADDLSVTKNRELVRVGFSIITSAKDIQSFTYLPPSYDYRGSGFVSLGVNNQCGLISGPFPKFVHVGCFSGSSSKNESLKNSRPS